MFWEFINNTNTIEDDGYLMAPKVENPSSSHPQPMRVQTLYSKPHATPTCFIIEPEQQMILVWATASEAKSYSTLILQLKYLQ